MAENINELKVFACEINGKRVDFPAGIPANSIKFVNDSVGELDKQLNKMKQWFNVEQIAQYCADSLKLETILSLKKITKKRKTINGVELKDIAMDIFNNYAGVEMKKSEISNYIHHKYNYDAAKSSTKCKEILQKIDGVYCTWNKETDLVKFIPKTKVSSENIGKLTYDNAVTTGLD